MEQHPDTPEWFKHFLVHHYEPVVKRIELKLDNLQASNDLSVLTQLTNTIDDPTSRYGSCLIAAFGLMRKNTHFEDSILQKVNRLSKLIIKIDKHRGELQKRGRFSVLLVEDDPMKLMMEILDAMDAKSHNISPELRLSIHLLLKDVRIIVRPIKSRMKEEGKREEKLDIV